VHRRPGAPAAALGVRARASRVEVLDSSSALTTAVGPSRIRSLYCRPVKTPNALLDLGHTPMWFGFELDRPRSLTRKPPR